MSNQGPSGPRRIEAGILLTILAVTGALAAFATLADEVGEGGAGRFDRIVLLAFRVPGRPDIAIGPRWIQEAARDVTALGGFTVLMLVLLVATAFLLIHGRRLQALVFVSTVALAQACERWGYGSPTATRTSSGRACRPRRTAACPRASS